MLHQYQIPENMSLVVNDYIPPYDFINNRGAMLRVNGSGRVSPYGSQGEIGATSAAMLAFDGDFELDIKQGAANVQSFDFTGSSFSGIINIKVDSLSSLNFINCSFEPGAVIRISGTTEEINFFGCNFEENTLVDLNGLDFGFYPEFVECQSAETAVVDVPDEPSPEINWKIPGLLLAAVSAIAVLKSTVKESQSDKKKEKAYVET